MQQLSSSPQQQTFIRAEARKSFAVTFYLVKQDDTPVDLTDAEMNMVIAQPAYKGGAIVLNKNATMVDAELGIMRVDIQAAELDLPAYEYLMVTTLVSAEGYSSAVLTGGFEVVANPDPAESVYNGVTPPLGLTLTLRDSNKVTVRVNHHPDSVLQAFSDQAEAAYQGAQVASISAAASAVSAAASATAAQTVVTADMSDLLDLALPAKVGNPADPVGAALSATIASEAIPSDGTARDVPAAAGSQVALADYAINGTRPYVFHLRTKSGSLAGQAAIAIGTDRGAANGILIAHKNTGAGVQLTNYAGTGIGAYFQNYSANAAIYAELYRNSGGIVVIAKNGEAFKDGFSTNGSTTFTSATANFTGADVGSAIVQQSSRDADDPFGCIPSGTTIASVTNATTVVLSQPATATAAGTGILFRIASRAPDANQKMIDVLDTDGTTTLLRFRRNALAVVVPSTLTTNDVALPGARVNGKAGQTANIFEVHQDAASATASVRISSTGKLVTTRSGYLGNASLTTVEPLVVQNFGTGVRSVAIIGVAAQTADQLALLDSASAVQSRFDKDGYFITKKQTAIADAQLVAGEVAIWFDSTNGAAKVKFKAKEAGGTVRTGEVALA